MNSLLPSTSASSILQSSGLDQGTPDESQLTTKEAFQDFVAGTFYKQMLKSLRKTHDKAPYFHGGQAEEVFQGQLDQQIAEDLARSEGAPFSDALYRVFQQNLRAKTTGGTTAGVEAAYSAATETG